MRRRPGRWTGRTAGVILGVVIGVVATVAVTCLFGCSWSSPSGGGSTSGSDGASPSAVTVPGSSSSTPPDSSPGDGSTTTAGSGPAGSTTVPYASTTSEPPRPSTTLPPRPSVALPEEGLEYSRLPGDERVVALTFDAAYAPEPLTDILAALEDHGAPATFFLTGEYVEDFPDDVRAIVDSGHPIGNHSYSHPDFTGLSEDQIERQLTRTAALLDEAGAADPRPLFRFPYGARDRQALARVGAQGYESVYWTIDTLDWKPERTPVAIRDDVLDKVRPGAIILMHVGSGQTASILPRLLDDLTAAGYDFVDLRSALPAVTD